MKKYIAVTDKQRQLIIDAFKITLENPGSDDPLGQVELTP